MAVLLFPEVSSSILRLRMFPGSAKQLAGFELRFSELSTAFPTQRPFSRVKKGTQKAKYSAQSFGAGFMDDAQGQKPAPFFILKEIEGQQWNKAPTSQSSLHRTSKNGQ